LQTFNGHSNDVLDAKASCDSSQITSASMDKCVFLWDVTTAQVIRRYRAHHSYVNCVQFNEESTVILSASVDGTVKIWDCKSHNKDPIQVLDEAKDSVTSVSVSDHEILTGSLDQKIRRYDIRKGIMLCDHIKSKFIS
jgi:mitogen-activated protein kinase organizer 1